MSESQATIFADGGSRGNPGPAGCGAVIEVDGKAVAELKKYLGVTTNNVAEYTGLVMGLEKALELGLKRVQVKMDSELAVRQMIGQYRVKNAKLLPLYEKAKSLSMRFASFEILHVRREQNKHADKLANEAMDAGKVEQGG